MRDELDLPRQLDRRRRRTRRLSAIAGCAALAVAVAAALHVDATGRSETREVAARASEATTVPKRPTTTSSTSSTTSTATPTTAAPTTAAPTTAAPTTAAPTSAARSDAPVAPAEADRVAPPQTATPACASSPGPLPQWGPDPSKYDPATVVRVSDPSATRCPATRRVLVVGDSTGRGAANALRRMAPAELQVWDRTEIGCGMVAAGNCPSWRRIWQRAIDEIHPDVVLVHLGASGDLVAGEDPPFTSPQASTLRRSEMNEAIRLLSSRGARVLWALPAVPLPSAWFFCGGTIPDTPCDAVWVERWHVDVRAAASPLGAGVADVRAWITGRPVAPSVDRPDGLHLTGPALDDEARWLIPTLRALAG